MKLYKFALIILCLFSVFLVKAQIPNQIDSLEILLKFSKNQNSRIDLLMSIAKKLELNDPKRAISYVKEAYELSTTINDNTKTLNSLIWLAKLYLIQTNYKISIDYASQAIKMSENLKLKKELALANLVMGKIVLRLGFYEKSSEFFFYSMKLFDELKDNKGICDVLAGISLMHANQNDFTNSLKYNSRSMEIAVEINYSEGISRGFNNMAAIYGEWGDFEKFLLYLEEAFKINKSIGNKYGEAFYYLNLSSYSNDIGEAFKSLEYVQKALDLFKYLNITHYIPRCYIQIGDSYFMQGDTKNSLKNWMIAYEIGRKYKFKDIIIDASKRIRDLYFDKNEIDSVKKYTHIHAALKDSLHIENFNNSISKFEIQFEIEKKEHLDEIKAQKRKNLFILFAIIFVSVLIIFVLRQRLKIKDTKIDNINLHNKLETKNKELTTNVLYSIKKNEILLTLTEELVEIEKNATKEETKNAIKKISEKIHHSTNNEVWKEFEIRFQQVHIEFYKSLAKSFPSLTPNEKRLCAFLRLDMTTKEISGITGQSINALEMARIRLRKKLGISHSNINLVSFLGEY